MPSGLQTFSRRLVRDTVAPARAKGEAPTHGRAVVVPAWERARGGWDAHRRRLPRRRPRERVRYARARGGRAGAARPRARVPQRAGGTLAALAGRVRLEGVPVHGRPAGDGRGGPRARCRRGGRDRHRAEGRRGAGVAGPARQRQVRRGDRDGRAAWARARRGRQRRRRRPARGDGARRPRTGRARARDPRRDGRHARPCAHRARGIEVRAGAEGRRGS